MFDGYLTYKKYTRFSVDQMSFLILHNNITFSTSTQHNIIRFPRKYDFQARFGRIDLTFIRIEFNNSFKIIIIFTIRPGKKNV